MKIAFYFVDENYINYLKEYKINHCGFTIVPNGVYSSRNKFLYGTVLEIDRNINALCPLAVNFFRLIGVNSLFLYLLFLSWKV